MKKFLLALAAVASISLYGQNQLVTSAAQVGDSTRTKPWKHSGLYSFAVVQTSLTNWAAGGNNNINTSALLKQLAVYSKNKWTWNNLLEANFGYNFQDDYRLKTDDRLEFTTRLDRELGSQDWRLSVFANIRTQFIDGFTKPEDTVRISTFMAPGYLTYGLGITNKSVKGLGIYFSPVQIKNTIVLDSTLFFGNQFYDHTGPNIIELSRGGMRWELGAYLDVFYKASVTDNLELATRLNLFSNYLDRPQNIDVNWEFIAALKAWKAITVLLQLNLIYDHDVLVQNPNAEGKFQSPGTQFKQILGVGLAYSFGEFKK
jgi:hypothetical protein